jgi:hypothetical protein
MKTDRVLTMDEYLNEIRVLSKHVTPLAGNARHIPITTESDVRSDRGAHGCRCDRWGHPCPGCVERKLQTRITPPNFMSETSEVNKWNT